MKFRMWLVAFLLSVGAVTGAVRADEVETKTTRGPETSVRRNDVPVTGYTNVGGNPRGKSVTGWSDALRYMESAGYRNDVQVRLIQGVPDSFRPLYKEKLVPELYRLIHLAVNNRYMSGGNPTPDVARELREKVSRVQIELGTFYLAVTEGQGGGAKARFNRSFRDATGEYFAYRIKVEVPIKRFGDAKGGKLTTVWARTFFDLIVQCRNTALGEVKVWEVRSIELHVPETFVPEAPPVRPPDVYATAEVKAKAQAEAEATATGGTAVVNNYAPKPELSYHRPDQSTYESSTYRAGGLTLQAVPVVNATASARQFQQQQQHQWQDQFLSFWQSIVNQNMNNVSVGVAAGG